MAKGVFVSYRRDDAAHITGRIHDALVARLGQARVFMDVDSVAPGEDFVKKIRDTIAASDVFLVIIGPSWLGARTGDGRRRIDLPGDFVRLELSVALAQGLKIIPVLVDGADMPRAEDLPEDVAQLVRHNAVFLTHATFKRDMDALAAGVTQRSLGARLKTPQGLALLAGLLAAAALAVAVTRGTGGEAIGAAVMADASSAVSLAEGQDTSGRQRHIASNGFRAERASDGRLTVSADAPYRERLYGAGEVTGIEFMGSAFYAASAELEVTVTNRTQAVMAIREIQFEVLAATPDLRPVPVIREHAIEYRRMVLFNEGWGPMEPVRIRIDSWGLPETDLEKQMRTWRGSVRVPDPCAEPARPMPGPGAFMEAAPDTYTGNPVIELEDFIPAGYDGAPFVCALGEMQFTALGETRTAAFRARVSNLLPTLIVAAPGFATHDLYLDPERSGYVAVVPASFDVPAGETVTVTVVVHTDKSSAFSLAQRLRTADGRLVPGEAFDLEFFVPKNGGAYSILNPERMADLPPDILAGFQGAPASLSAKYDPQGRSPAEVYLTEGMADTDCVRLARHVSQRLAGVTGSSEPDVIVYGPGESWLCARPPSD